MRPVLSTEVYTIYSNWFDYSVVAILTTPHCMISVCLYIQYYSCLHAASNNYSYLFWKSLQIENFLTVATNQTGTVHATYFSTYPSPVSLENPYKWKISLQLNSACNIYLSKYSSPVSLENPYKLKISLQPTSACNTPFHVSLPCLSGKSIQKENFLTT